MARPLHSKRHEQSIEINNQKNKQNEKVSFTHSHRNRSLHHP
jgi:hypothetical protein